VLGPIRRQALIGAVAAATVCACRSSSERPSGDRGAAGAAAGSAAPAPSPTAAGAWRCFVADPYTPTIAAGNVTHMKERLLPDQFETENVSVRDGVAGASRFVYHRVGDHFEAPMGEGTLTLRMLSADGSHRTVHYQDATGWEFTDETVIDAHGLTIESTDYDADHKPVETTVHHVPAPCYVVDAELAKYPS